MPGKRIQKIEGKRVGPRPTQQRTSEEDTFMSYDSLCTCHEPSFQLLVFAPGRKPSEGGRERERGRGREGEGEGERERESARERGKETERVCEREIERERERERPELVRTLPHEC